MDYTRLSNRVLSLVTKYGTPITISYYSPGTYNAVEGSYSSTTFSNTGTVAVFDTVTGLSGRQGLSGDALQTVLEQKVDIVGYVPASGLTISPSIKDRIKRNGEVFEILYPEEIKPAEVSLMWILFLRKG